VAGFVAHGTQLAAMSKGSTRTHDATNGASLSGNAVAVAVAQASTRGEEPGNNVQRKPRER
jgi:hypothetical protein